MDDVPRSAQSLVTLSLASDWDEGVSAPRSEQAPKHGHFCGRQDEMRALALELQTKSSGSVLVAGHRGVGKTSLVYEAIRLAQSRNAKLVPVILYAPQLEVEKPTKQKEPTAAESATQQLAVVKNMIRRLYATSQATKNWPEDSRDEIERLYKKAVASEFKLYDHSLDVDDSSQEATSSARTSISLDLAGMASTVIGLAVGMCLWLLGDVRSWGPVWPVVLKALSALSVLAGSAATVHTRQTAQRKTRVGRSVHTGEQLYGFDNSVGNLVSDLEKAHSGLTGGFRLVYVIDEIDKVEASSILAGFKSLFTLSQALFIFVAGEDAFGEGRPPVSSAAAPRDPLYTYFTSRYYVCRPRWQDLKAYMDEVMQPEPTMRKEDVDTIQRALAFDATNDFFDLKEKMRDRIAGLKGESPVLGVNLSPEVSSRAAAHALVTKVYEDYVRQSSPSAWRANEQAQRDLFVEMNRVRALSPGTAIGPLPDLASLKGPKERLHVALWRTGAAELIVVRTQSHRADEPSQQQLRYNGSIPDVPQDAFLPSSDEDCYVSAVRKVGCTALGLLNAVQALRGAKPYTEESLWRAPDKLLDEIKGHGVDWIELLSSHRERYLILTACPPGRVDLPVLQRERSSLERNWLITWDHLPQALARAIATGLRGLQVVPAEVNASQPLASKLEAPIRDAFLAGHPWLLTIPSGQAIVLMQAPSEDALANLKTVAAVGSNIHYFALTEGAASVLPGTLNVYTVATPDALAAELPKLALAVNRVLVAASDAT